MSKYSYVYLMSVSRTVQVPLTTLVEWHKERHEFQSLEDAEEDLLSFGGLSRKPFAELEMTLLAGTIVMEKGHPISLVVPQALPKEFYCLLDPKEYNPSRSGALAVAVLDEAA